MILNCHSLFSCSRMIISQRHVFIAYYVLIVYMLLCVWLPAAHWFSYVLQQIMLKSTTIVLYITSRPWQIQQSHQKHRCLIKLLTCLKSSITLLTKKVEKIWLLFLFRNMIFSKLFGDHLGIIWVTFRGLLGVCFQYFLILLGTF